MTPTARRSALGRLGGIVLPWRGALGYAAFTLAVFLIALLYQLPHEQIARRALDEVATELPVHIGFADVGFAFPNGYRFRDVRVSARGYPGRSVEISDLTVRTPLVGLLLGNPDAATFSGELYGGSFEGAVHAAEGEIRTEVEARDVPLTPLSRRLLPPPGAVGGTASFDLQLRGDGQTSRSLEGTVSLRAQDVALEGIVAQGFTVPDLSFRTADVEAAIQGTRLQLDSVAASGDEVSLGAKGDVLLRDPADRSVLNLEVQIDVSPEARPGLRVATSLLPKRGPGQPNRWSLRGSLASPSLR